MQAVTDMSNNEVQNEDILETKSETMELSYTEHTPQDEQEVPNTDKKVMKEKKSRVKKVKRLSEDQIRINHVSSEKKRRELVRAIYDELVMLVPGLQKNENRSELIIYQKTINYLSWLYEKNGALREQLNDKSLLPEDLVWELPSTVKRQRPE